jgi:predicted DNA-binding transcriptional regulator
MSKDQAIGGLIFIVCAVVIVGYLVALFYPKIILDILPGHTEAGVRYWLAEIPVLIAFVAVLAIGAWIGWTMATTPPPKPIEEIEAEEKKEEEKEKAVGEEEEKKK